jgi:hypothetical protein
MCESDEEVMERLSEMNVSESLMREVARRAAAKYFDMGIDPRFLACLGQREVDQSPVGMMMICILNAFKDMVRYPLQPEDLA